MTGTWVHFTDGETLTVESRRQGDADKHGIGKPAGLWVSDESAGSYGWRAWCGDEQWGIGPSAFAIEFAADARLLTLATAEQIREFTAEYVPPNSTMLPRMLQRMMVDWPRVAESYQGILISPYQWECRLDEFTGWYYGWDCASGCIWDAAAVASARKLDTATLAPVGEGDEQVRP